LKNKKFHRTKSTRFVQAVNIDRLCTYSCDNFSTVIEFMAF